VLLGLSRIEFDRRVVAEDQPRANGGVDVVFESIRLGV
jgi:hypothetical protein